MSAATDALLGHCDLNDVSRTAVESKSNRTCNRQSSKCHPCRNVIASHLNMSALSHVTRINYFPSSVVFAQQRI